MKKCLFALAAALCGASVFAVAGDFLPSGIATEIQTTLGNAETDLTTLLTTNFGTIVKIIAVFLLIPLGWWVIGIIKKAFSRGK